MKITWSCCSHDFISQNLQIWKCQWVGELGQLPRTCWSERCGTGSRRNPLKVLFFFNRRFGDVSSMDSSSSDSILVGSFVIPSTPKAKLIITDVEVIKPRL